MVEEGDILVELDSSVFEEKEKQQEISMTQAKAAWEQAIEQLEIQRKQNDSDIAAAKLKVKLAALDLEKFEKGEYPQQLKQLEGNVALAQEELLRGQENYQFMKDQVKKGFKTQNDLETARIAVKKAELSLQGAEEELKVLTEYTYKRTMEELKENAEEYKRELARTELKAKAAETQYVADVEARKLTYEIEKEQWEKTKAQKEACVLIAPQAGEVVYANMGGGRRSSEPVNIEEGATVRERQAIINLPDVTQMKVDCRIHESLIGDIRKGLPCRIRIDAYPGEIYNGVVASVSSVPMAGSWPNTDLREYATEIHLNDEVEKVRKLRPGLTAQVEILIDNRSDILQVPVQSILTIGGKQFSFVINNGEAELRTVKIGQSNQSHVEILDGIEEGERVVLNPRSRYPKKISDLEADLAKQEGEEVSDIEVPQAPAKDEQAKSGQEKPAAAEGGGGPGGGFDPAQFFTRLDKDGDGAISKDEAPDRLKENFDKMDQDSDGKITKEEFSAAARSRPGQ